METGGGRSWCSRPLRFRGARKKLGTSGKSGPPLDWCRPRRGCSRIPAGFEALVKTFHNSLRNLLCITGLLSLSLRTMAVQEDVGTIIRRSVDANNRDWAAVPEFDNSERDRNKDGDKTYEVTMLYGSPYQRLIAVNGHPLPAARQKQEQEKYDKAVADRQHESPEQRSQRIAKYEAERKRDHTLIEQMTAAFDF